MAVSPKAVGSPSPGKQAQRADDSGSENEEEETSLSPTQCLLCHDLLTLPKLLPCGHLVCRHCLVAWLLAQPEAVCPHEQCACAVAEVRKDDSGGLGRKEAEEIADDLPTDLAMEALVEVERTLSRPQLCCVCSHAEDDDIDQQPEAGRSEQQGLQHNDNGSSKTSQQSGQKAATGSPALQTGSSLGHSLAGPESPKSRWEMNSPTRDSPTQGLNDLSPPVSPSVGGTTVSSEGSEAAPGLPRTSAGSANAAACAPVHGGRPVAAICYCLQCRDAFCRTCGMVHRRQGATRHHEVRPLSALTPPLLLATSARQADTCQAHRGQVLSQYCTTHDTALCDHCRADPQHYQCPEVTSLEARLEQARADLSEAASTLRSAREDVDQAVKLLEKQLQDAQHMTSSAEAEVDKTCDVLTAAVEACRRRLKDLARSARSDVITAVSERSDYLLQRQQLVTSYEEALQRTSLLPGNSALARMAATLKARVMDLDLAVALPTDARVTAKVTLALDQQGVIRVEEELSKLGRINFEAELLFHSNHGKNVVLSNNGRTAQKTSIHRNHGIVMSRDPMFTNMLYEVRIERVQLQYKLTRLGVVADSPQSFADLPSTFFCPDPDVLCVDHDGAYLFGHKDSTPRPELRELAAGRRVGLALDSERSLHLYVDGQRASLVAKDVPDTVFFMFDLFARCTKVTALPVNSDI